MNIRQFVLLPAILIGVVSIIYYLIPTNYYLIKTRVLYAGMVSLLLYYSVIRVQYGIIGVFVWIVCAQLYQIQYEIAYRKANEIFHRRISDKIQSLNQAEIQPTNPIPKHIIQIWVDKTPGGSMPVKYKKYMEQIQAMHPEYQYLFFNGPDIDKFFQMNYPEYYTTYLRLPAFIQKLDFFRYLAIYHYGGFYMDVDIQMYKSLDDEIRNHQSVFPIDEYINDSQCGNSRFVPICNAKQQFLLGQYMFGAVPRHPFIKHLVDTIHSNIDFYIKQFRMGESQEIYVYRTTGPDFVSYLYSGYAGKNQVYILANGKRQMFGDYAEHQYYGSWKTGTE